jgi:hypothetical protein
MYDKGKAPGGTDYICDSLMGGFVVHIFFIFVKHTVQI